MAKYEGMDDCPEEGNEREIPKVILPSPCCVGLNHCEESSSVEITTTPITKIGVTTNDQTLITSHLTNNSNTVEGPKNIIATPIFCNILLSNGYVSQRIPNTHTTSGIKLHHLLLKNESIFSIFLFSSQFYGFIDNKKNGNDKKENRERDSLFKIVTKNPPPLLGMIRIRKAETSIHHRAIRLHT